MLGYYFRNEFAKHFCLWQKYSIYLLTHLFCFVFSLKVILITCINLSLAQISMRNSANNRKLFWLLLYLPLLKKKSLFKFMTTYLKWVLRFLFRHTHFLFHSLLASYGCLFHTVCSFFTFSWWLWFHFIRNGCCQMRISKDPTTTWAHQFVRVPYIFQLLLWLDRLYFFLRQTPPLLQSLSSLIYLRKSLQELNSYINSYISCPTW